MVTSGSKKGPTRSIVTRSNGMVTTSLHTNGAFGGGALFITWHLAQDLQCLTMSAVMPGHTKLLRILTIAYRYELA